MQNVISTIEELVVLATKDPETRYSMDEDVNYEYDDPVAGKAWQEGEDAYTGEYVSYGQPGHEEYQEKWNEYQKLQPSKHPVKTYRLKKSYYTKYVLSESLGSQVEAIWTKKPSRYSNRDVHAGLLTLPGILKRLGQTDVVDKIKDEKARVEESRKVQRRNNYRASLRRQLDELEKWVNQYGSEIGVTPDMFQLPVELADALKDE